MSAGETIHEQYQAALAALTEKLKRDSTVIAAVLLGSLAHDVVWEKSDIDLVVVTQEGKLRLQSVCLVENGINIHVSLMTRSEFRREMEGVAQGRTPLHYRSRLLYSRDETLHELFAHRDRVGGRDREASLLRMTTWLLPGLTKAEKWLRVKEDPDYCFVWIMNCLHAFAGILVLLHGETPGRELLHQAKRHEPELVDAVYHRLIHGERGPNALNEAIELMRNTLLDRRDAIFGPVLEHLAEADGVRSTTALNHHFEMHLGLHGLDGVYEWLADEGVLQKTGVALRLTDRSRTDVEEAAYFLPG